MNNTTYSIEQIERKIRSLHDEIEYYTDILEFLREDRSDIDIAIRTWNEQLKDKYINIGFRWKWTIGGALKPTFKKIDYIGPKYGIIILPPKRNRGIVHQTNNCLDISSYERYIRSKSDSVALCYCSNSIDELMPRQHRAIIDQYINYKRVLFANHKYHFID